MYWKFTYIWWYSVYREEQIVKADSESEAYKKFNSHFGYEDIDIKDCQQITEEEAMSEIVWE